MTKIKPCPLCGHKPKVSFVLSNIFICQIKCPECGLNIQYSCDGKEYTGVSDSNPGDKFIEIESSLVNKWNERVEENKR